MRFHLALHKYCVVRNWEVPPFLNNNVIAKSGVCTGYFMKGNKQINAISKCEYAYMLAFMGTVNM